MVWLTSLLLYSFPVKDSGSSHTAGNLIILSLTLCPLKKSLHFRYVFHKLNPYFGASEDFQVSHLHLLKYYVCRQL